MSYAITLPGGARLVFDVYADDAEKVLGDLMDRLSHKRDIMKIMARAMRLDIRRQFADAGDPPWKALKRSTIREKERLGLPALTKKGNIPRRLMQNGVFGPQNILIRTGRLRDSWGTVWNSDHYENLDESTGDITIGTKIWYAIYHQQPFGPGRNIIPKRAINVSRPGAEAMRAAFSNYLSSFPGISVDVAGETMPTV